ncbi:MAG: ferredoxin-type protein NapG [Hahellaceae bacterium]|nr:ferredoxin-type protein NapG [Hahellaceae bacterium]MCP5168303.1 ferredoxin-type protein NapG [Hahellaceae bacterium]
MKVTQPKPQARNTLSRRQFLTDTGHAACSVGLIGLGLGMYGQQSVVHATQALRPPGALDEEHFLGACVRCGLCVEDCPYDTLKLGRLFDPVTTGTPYFDARKVPCEMCDDIPCVKACPTGALDPELTDIDQSRMGLAVLIDRENCLNMQGLRCDVCYRVCPLIDKAITLTMLRNPRTGVHAIFEPVVHSDACTGCGKCEHACVLEEAAIKVFPHNLAKGELGAHYRWGWKEKEKAGEALVPDIIDLPDRRPELEGLPINGMPPLGGNSGKGGF